MDQVIYDETITVPELVLAEVFKPKVAPRKSARWRWLDDGWFLTTLVTAALASVGSWAYFFSQHQTLLYNDAHSHLDIARRIIDNQTPGLAQLGGVWLPLPHLVMLPFIWSDALWRSGLAGSFPSMICFVVTSAYLFLAARRLTGDGRASFIGLLALVLNPNILYLQSTPLSEMVALAAITATCYYLVVWAQEDHVISLVSLAIATFLATMARYDGWALFLGCLVLVVLIGIRKGFSREKIRATALFYAMSGGLGIGLWLLWNRIIFGDWLYFQRSEYSAQDQQQLYINRHLDPMYHNLTMSVRNVTVLVGETVGPILLVALALALITYIARARVSSAVLAASALLIPVAFYVISCFTGQAIIFAPGAAPVGVHVAWFNARYGTSIVPPVAVFIATLVSRWPLGQIVMSALIAIQSLMVAHGGIISLQDGQFGYSCEPASAIPAYLAQHYDGGLILDDAYHTGQDFAAAGIHLKQVIYQGSGHLWQQSLADPAAHVAWIVTQPDDLVSRRIATSSDAFQSQFTLVMQDPLSGVYLYRRSDLPPLPTRTLPQDLTRNDYALCHP
jgi:hypothetical protein